MQKRNRTYSSVILHICGLTIHILFTAVAGDCQVRFFSKADVDVCPITNYEDPIVASWNLNIVQGRMISVNRSVLSANLKTDGTLPVYVKNPSMEYITANIEGEFLFSQGYKFGTGIIKRGTTTVSSDYYTYFGLKPFKYEYGNYAGIQKRLLEPYFATDIWFTDIIPYAWNRLINLQEGKFRTLTRQPLKAKYGYCLDLDHMDQPGRHDILLQLDMALLSNLFIDCVLQYFVTPDSTYEYHSISLTYPFSEKYGIVLKTISGRLPPDYTQVNSTALGFKLEY